MHNVLPFSAIVWAEEARESFLCHAFICFPFTVIWKRRTSVFIVLQKSVYGKKSKSLVLFCNLDWNISPNMHTFRCNRFIVCILNPAGGICGTFSQALVIHHEGLSNTRFYRTNEAVLQVEIPPDTLPSAEGYFPTASQLPISWLIPKDKCGYAETGEHKVKLLSITC